MYWFRQRFQSKLASPILARYYGTGGRRVSTVDWDNLLVYDACRADMFEAVVGTDEFDSYERVNSLGTSSPDWYEENFEDRALGDTVCVTANPWTARIAGDSFHALVDVWQEQQPSGSESGLEDRDLSRSIDATVTASQLSSRAREVADRYPNKRMLVHYFQPHAPCIGSENGDTKPPEALNPDLHPGRSLQKGRVDRTTVWDAYCENLSYVHTHGQQLAKELGGRTVFTSDHGELFGEWLCPFPMRGYAHPERLRHPKLVEVPWATVTIGDRRTIQEETVESYEVDRKAVEQRLQELGYA